MIKNLYLLKEHTTEKFIKEFQYRETMTDLKFMFW